MYAAIVAVQFTIVNWTHPVGAYRFGLSNMYATIGAVQFTIVNWTHHVGAYKILRQSYCNDGDYYESSMGENGWISMPEV